MDENLAKDKEISFNACSHRKVIRLDWEDFANDGEAGNDSLRQPKPLNYLG